jgi:predicted metal-binding protein
VSAVESETDQMVLRLCHGCTGTGLSGGRKALGKALREAGLEGRVRIARASCLGGCEEPRSIALQSAGRASYVFSDLDLTKDAADIVATCALYLQAPQGWIEDAQPCGRLRWCLRARIPALEA